MFPLSAAGPPPPAGEAGLRRLAANLAHNINNTLTGVIGYLELALRETPAGSSAHHHLQRSLTCAHRIAEMVRRILAFAVQPAGEGNLAPVSLRAVTEQLARSVREPRVFPEIKVEVRADADGLIQANRSLLLLVLDQLLSNALEAMPLGGRLTFRVWEETGRCCLSLADTGRGMPSRVLAHLFEPFFTTKVSGHIGLGLSLSRDAIAAMGGAICVASVEDKGTTVTLSFPSAEQSRREEQPFDKQIGLLLSSRLSWPAGPHFGRGQPADPSLSPPSYTI